jgi:hypothetical protein
MMLELAPGAAVVTGVSKSLRVSRYFSGGGETLTLLGYHRLAGHDIATKKTRCRLPLFSLFDSLG